MRAYKRRIKTFEISSMTNIDIVVNNWLDEHDTYTLDDLKITKEGLKIYVTILYTEQLLAL